MLLLFWLLVDDVASAGGVFIFFTTVMRNVRVRIATATATALYQRISIYPRVHGLSLGLIDSYCCLCSWFENMLFLFFVRRPGRRRCRVVRCRCC